MEHPMPPFRSSLAVYDQHAELLLASWRARHPAAAGLFRCSLPRFLREDVPWLSKDISDDEIFAAGLDLGDARLAVARRCSFLDWPSLVSWVNALADAGSGVERFESAVEAVIEGDAPSLGQMLRDHPWLAAARSERVNCFDPPVHRATLLHYLGANGVEVHRQNSPANAVEIAQLLLDAGAEPDSLAALYGGECTTMSLLVSSSHAADAGVQVPLVETLVKAGASVEALGTGHWQSPLMTALAFGFMAAAETLVRLGARSNTLPAAAGFGRLEEAARLLAEAGPEERHRALALASQQGHVSIVGLLLDAGEDLDRFNPPGLHAHATPMHQAIAGGHQAVVELLAERGARLDLRDRIWGSTPLGWAEHFENQAIAAYLRSR
jgi:hypothetical protein